MLVRCRNCFGSHEESEKCPYCGYREAQTTRDVFCLELGTRVADRYIIGQVLGMGGFGITYKAWDEQLDIVVAVKEYFPSGLVNRSRGIPDILLVAAKRREEYEAGMRRFLEEARNVVKFSKHKNIVNIYDYFEANNTAYIVMEYLEGQTLSDKLQEKKTALPLAECMMIAAAMCEALTAIHAEHILHRDISPDNIMLCKNGTVKLFDFGAARFSAVPEEDTSIAVVVKPGFAPPEQYDKVHRQDERTDLYALGATIYYALTGQKPDESTNRSIEDIVVAPELINPAIPHNISNIILRSMAVEAEYRFSAAKEFAEALVSGKNIASPAELKEQQKKKKVFGIAAAVTAIGVGAVLFVGGLVFQKEENTLPPAEIHVWYIEKEADTGRKEDLEQIAESFMAGYEGVVINMEGIPAGMYEERLEQAIEQNNLPVIFESTGVSDTYTSVMAPLTELFERADDNPYVSNLHTAIGSDKQYPTGMLLPMIYVNTSSGVTLQEVSSLEMVQDAEANYLIANENAAQMYSTLFGQEALTVTENAAELFASGDYAVMLGTSDDWFWVQTALMGRCDVIAPVTENSTYTYADLWSICKDAKEDEAEVAEAFLEYMTDNVNQEILHFGTANDHAMPVEAAALETYKTVYMEFGDAEITEFLKAPYKKP